MNPIPDDEAIAYVKEFLKSPAGQMFFRIIERRKKELEQSRREQQEYLDYKSKFTEDNIEKINELSLKIDTFDEIVAFLEDSANITL